MQKLKSSFTFVLDQLCNALLVNGWGFIVPYLMAYLQSWQSKSPIEQLYHIFLALHIFHGLLFAYLIYRKKHKIQKKELLFWIMIALIVLLPGAYLEYPSDPWSHFRRIFSFQNTDLIAESFIRHKFSYFWGWTLMSEIPPLYRRLALDIYSAFWQLLFYYQFYLLAFKFGFNKHWSKILIIGVLFLFGTYTWTFRYYAISSTIVAYVAYIRSIIVLINIKKGDLKQLLLLPFLVLIMYANHFQEVMLFGISTLAIILDYLVDKNRKWAISGFLVVFALSLLWGYLKINDPNLETHPLWTVDELYVSVVGNFKIWVKDFSYFHTTGIHGMMSLLFALFLFRKYQTISILTLAPYFMLLFPPFVYLFTTNHGSPSNWVTYRALFAFPTSFMLILGFKEVGLFLINQGKFSRYKKILPFLIVLIITLIPPQYPLRGRSWFQLYTAPPELSLKNLDPTAQWFYENRNLDNSCFIVTDKVTRFLLETHFALKLQPPRRTIPYNISNKIQTKPQLKSHIKNNNVCRFLIAQHNKLPDIPSSKVAEISGHWDPNLVRHNLTLTPEFEALVDSLQAEGWTKTFVPPFYWLYEAPKLNQVNPE